MGTRGSAEDRAREAADAARILKVSWRHALDIPDGRVENTWENRLKVARVLREHDVTVLTRAEEALALLAAGKRFDVIIDLHRLRRFYTNS